MPAPASLRGGLGVYVTPSSRGENQGCFLPSRPQPWHVALQAGYLTVKRIRGLEPSSGLV